MKVEDWIPDHETGVQTNTEHSVECADEDEARELYKQVRHRLLDINEWHRLAGTATASFQLVNGEGRPVRRLAQTGDYFRIDIPAPGTDAGAGHDWVRIENIDEHPEGTAIRVRPSPPPGGEDVGHFFSDSSTSSFIAWRHHTKVTAGVYGRNEKPNTDVSSLGDKIRNAAVAIGAFLGFSKLQWKTLVHGLIKG